MSKKSQGCSLGPGNPRFCEKHKMEPRDFEGNMGQYTQGIVLYYNLITQIGNSKIMDLMNWNS